VALTLAPPSARAMNGPYERAVTRVEVRLTQRLSARDARPGDLFTFDTTSSILIAGRFLPADTHGHGVVLAIRPGRSPQAARLSLAARSLDPSDGEPVEVGLEPGELAASADYDKGTRFFVDAPPPEVGNSGEARRTRNTYVHR